MFRVDLHCHTAEHSFDGRHPAADLVQQSRAAGFHGLVFTDHSYCWPPEELAELRASLGLPDDFLLLSGQEVRTAREGIVYGDILVYGVQQSLPDGTDPIEVFALVKQAGGFCIAAHPGAPHGGFNERVGDFPFAAIEVWNGRYGPKVAATSRELARRFGMIGVGGSDAHGPADVGRGATLFPRMPATLADIEKAIRAAEVQPWGMSLLGRMAARLEDWKG